MTGPFGPTCAVGAARSAAPWKRIVFALCFAAIAMPSPSDALPDGYPRLPPRPPDPDATPGPLETPQPTPPPTLPRLSIMDVGVDFIKIVVRSPGVGVARLYKQPPGGSFAPFGGGLTPGVETVIRDEDVGVGKQYCYRLTTTSLEGLEETTSCRSTEWRVGFEGLGISEAESAKVLRLFDWRDTEELATGSQSAPALYHMNVLVEGNHPGIEQALRDSGIHVQGEPIFHEELESWDDSQAIAQACDSGPVSLPTARSATEVTLPDGGCVPIGRWLFAVVPGHSYNQLRAEMLKQIGRGEAPGIRALVFRRVPVDEALGSGWYRHELNPVFLGEQGFEFNATQRCFTDENGDRLCTTEQPILGWLLNLVTGWIFEGVDAVVEAVCSVIGSITKLIKGEVTLRLNFRLLNTDPGFGTDEVMRSGWSGEQLHLSRVKIEVRQGLASFFEGTNDWGEVALSVARNSDTKVCIKVENYAAELTKFVVETTSCVANLGKLTDNETSRTIDVRKGFINTLAAMTDAYDYLHATAGITMPKITVLVGGHADRLAREGASFAPCMGNRPNLTLGLLADLVPVAGLTLEFLFAVDVVLRTEDDGSRGVPVHEYGHAVMCEMLQRRGLLVFGNVWTDVIFSTRSKGEISHVNEGFADFLTEQIVGGTNYFRGSGASDNSTSMNVAYCPAGSACFDANFFDRSTFKNRVARVTSILHDAFDGNPENNFGPNDGSHWVLGTSGTLAHVRAVDSDSKDEKVNLINSHLPDLFEHWDERGDTLSEEAFLGGLADLLKDEGFSESDVCALFALHDPSGTCPTFVAGADGAPFCGDNTVDAAEDCDLGAGTNGASGNCCTNECQLATAGAVCRAGAGDPNGSGFVCNPAETCSGASDACPTDIHHGSEICRGGGGGFCDPHETCPVGPDSVCGADILKSAGTVCSGVAGNLCDLAETCDGIAGHGCPMNVILPAGTVCRAGSGDVCDLAESCDGIAGRGCPVDVILPAGRVCRASADAICDIAESCTGIAGQTCPADAGVPAGTVCRPVNPGDECDLEETCGGAMTTCPADLRKPDSDGDTICDACGNGVVEGGEVCDGGGCCAADCSAVLAAGTTCRASSGACDVAENCDGASGACPADAAELPRDDCRVSVRPLVSKLQLKNTAADAGDALGWDWKLGERTTLADLGSPGQFHGAIYKLCVYDESGAVPTLVLGSEVAAWPGWTGLGGKGARFSDLFGTQGGITQILAKVGDDGRASVSVKGKGAPLGMPALPLGLPARVQLQVLGGACFEATFGAAGMRKNDSRQFQGFGN